MRILSERANVGLQKLFNQRPSKTRAQPPAEQASPYPRLGRPIVDVAQYQSATFNLLFGPPDFPADSGETRQAYALCDFTTNDVALLVWTATLGAGGFWTAVGCGGTASSPIEVSCPNCLSNVGPSLMSVSMSGVSIFAGGVVPLEDKEGVRDQFNLFTHFLTYNEDLGCTWIKEWTYAGISTHSLRLQVSVGPVITNLVASTYTNQDSNLNGNATFSKTVSSPDCDAIGAVTYQFQSQDPTFGLVSFSGASPTLSS